MNAFGYIILIIIFLGVVSISEKVDDLHEVLITQTIRE